MGKNKKDEVPELQKGEGTRIRALVKALADYDPVVRQDAEDALVGVGEDAVESLVHLALRNHSNASVRWYAARALGRIGNEKAVAPLCVALMDMDEDVSFEAVEAVEKIGDRSAVGPLEAFSKNQTYSSFHRKAAKQAIRTIEKGKKRQELTRVSKVAEEKDIDGLVIAVKSDDVAVRERAVDQLGKTQGPKAVPILLQAQKDDIRLARHVRTALITIGRAGVDSLISFLKDKDRTTRLLILLALEDIGDERAVEPLTLLSETDLDSDVRRAAQAAAQKIHSLG